MGTLRLWIRLPLFFLLTAVLGSIAGLVNTLIKRPFPRAAYRWRGGMTACWARCNGWVLGMKLEVEGSLPKEPYLLVTNHLGYVDILVLCALSPAFFISRADVRHWPFLGIIVRNSGNILFLDRSNKKDLLRVGEIVEREVDQGYSVAFFPEGTSSNGSSVLPFKPSLLQLAAERELPVTYGCIHYAAPEGALAAGELVCWWGDAEFFPHLMRLMRNRRFKARVRFGAEPLQNCDRKELAKDLHAAIVSLFEPLDNGPVHAE